MPTDWNMGLVFPIFTNGSKTECQNYTGITLVKVAYKTVPTIMARKLSLYSQEVFGVNTCADFVLAEALLNKYFFLRQSLEKHYKMALMSTGFLLIINRLLNVLIDITYTCHLRATTFQTSFAI